MNADVLNVNAESLPGAAQKAMAKTPDKQVFFTSISRSLAPSRAAPRSEAVRGSSFFAR
jgi:hypothetical protein